MQKSTFQRAAALSQAEARGDEWVIMASPSEGPQSGTHARHPGGAGPGPGAVTGHSQGHTPQGRAVRCLLLMGFVRADVSIVRWTAKSRGSKLKSMSVLHMVLGS